jgi:hypothetical protein
MYMVSLILVSLTLLYWLQMDKVIRAHTPRSRVSEGFVDFITALEGASLDALNPMPEGEQALLKDFIRVKAKTGVSNLSAKGCADSDQSRQQELGGQYVQRTNNYRRDNPDNCSAPLSDFVGSIYDQGSVGVTVPCDGDC